MSDEFVHFPEVRARLGIPTSERLKELCTRHQIRWIQFNARRFALRKSDVELLIERMTVIGKAA